MKNKKKMVFIVTHLSCIHKKTEHGKKTVSRFQQFQFLYDDCCSSFFPGSDWSSFFLILYFFIYFSTRPAVSTNFCFPVKNGWQFEQISILISPTVFRVWNEFPHAQVTVAIFNSGCISFFNLQTSNKMNSFQDIKIIKQKTQSKKKFSIIFSILDQPRF